MGAQLKDFNWAVNLAVASDSASSLNKPLVRLQLFLAGTAAIPLGCRRFPPDRSPDGATCRTQTPRDRQTRRKPFARCLSSSQLRSLTSSSRRSRKPTRRARLHARIGRPFGELPAARLKLPGGRYSHASTFSPKLAVGGCMFWS